MKSMYVRYVTMLLCIPSLLFLSSCTIMQWSATTFRQAQVVSSHFSQSMEPYIKSGVIYSEFASIAEFSALFLTDQARMIYADYFFNRNFKPQDEQDLARDRLLTENDYYITFYVIGYQPATIYPTERAMFFGEYQVQGPLLGSADAKWKITMIVDGKEYAPCDIRSAALPVEYQYFFGRRWSQFKTAYKVRFDCRDDFGQEILPAGPHHVVLNFRSVIYDAKLEWLDMPYKLEN
jgi:hypothetical protein